MHLCEMELLTFLISAQSRSNLVVIWADLDRPDRHRQKALHDAQKKAKQEVRATDMSKAKAPAVAKPPGAAAAVPKSGAAPGGPQ